MRNVPLNSFLRRNSDFSLLRLSFPGQAYLGLVPRVTSCHLELPNEKLLKGGT